MPSAKLNGFLQWSEEKNYFKGGDSAKLEGFLVSWENWFRIAKLLGGCKFQSKMVFSNQFKSKISILHLPKCQIKLAFTVVGRDKTTLRRWEREIKRLFSTVRKCYDYEAFKKKQIKISTSWGQC